jgi:hypothetical protein
MHSYLMSIAELHGVDLAVEGEKENLCESQHEIEIESIKHEDLVEHELKDI